MRTVLLTLVAIALTALQAAAASHTSVTRGGRLFNDPSLGSNGKSCASCHPDGEGLAKITRYNDAELAKKTNECITKALEGKPLATDSAEMGSLILYMHSLSSAKNRY
jgi:cytochrome c